MFKGLWENRKRKRRSRRKLAEWIAAGRPMPPPGAYKQKTILEYRQAFGPEIFIETGTYKGKMVQAVSHAFQRI